MPCGPPKESCHRTPKHRFAGCRRKPPGTAAARKAAARHCAPWPGCLRPRPHGRVHRKRDAGLRRSQLGDHRGHPALGYGGAPAGAARRAVHRDRAGERSRAAPRGFEHRGGHLRAGQPRQPWWTGSPTRRRRSSRSPSRRRGTGSIRSTGSLNTADEQVRADLAGQPPQTAIGQIARGLQQRARADAGPLTVVSCDNLPGNGELTGSWCVPSPPRCRRPRRSRCWPGSTRTSRSPTRWWTGWCRPRRPVTLTPSNANWVSGTRPPWWPNRSCSGSSRTTSPRAARGGRTPGPLFSTDVAAWEAAKLRLLNASHSMLAYLGLAAGKTTISDAVGEDAFLTACRRMMARGRPAHHQPPGRTGRGRVLRPGAQPVRESRTGPHHGQGGQRRLAEDRAAAAQHRPRKPRRRPRTAVGRARCCCLDAPRGRPRRRNSWTTPLRRNSTRPCPRRVPPLRWSRRCWAAAASSTANWRHTLFSPASSRTGTALSTRTGWTA